MSDVGRVGAMLEKAGLAGAGWAGRGRFVLGMWFVLAGAAYLLTALLTMTAFAWMQPTMDQFRLYPIYLELPFPENVLQRENGHRPILPGLVRVLEIHWLGANQQLQFIVGTLCALATAMCAVWTVLREPRLGVLARLAGAMLAVMAVFWLGNARMLLHGNELVHAYLLTLSVMLGALCVWRARGRPWWWMGWASACAVVATFCFGPGLALFPALALAAWCVGVSWRAALVPMLVCAGCAVLYLFVLPGDEAVRDSLVISLRDTPLLAARWIASPWINGWLGYADPPLNASFADVMAGRYRGVLADTANAVQAMAGLQATDGLAAMIGMGGYAVLAGTLLCGLRDRQALSRLDTLALVLMLFGAATALLIALARHDYFQDHPEQVFADRYLIWPCLFWLGVAFALLGMTGRIGQRVKSVMIALAVCVPVVAYPTHELWAGWSEAVHRSNQASAAAVRSDVFDADVLMRNDTSVTLEAKLHALALFRERGLAMFATPGAQWLGERLLVTPERDRTIRIGMRSRRAVDDLRAGASQGGRIDGLVREGAGRIPDDSVLVVLDAEGRVVGFAEFTFRLPEGRWRRLHRKPGFDAFVRDYDATADYQLVAVAPDARSALLLGELPAQR